MPQLDVSTYPSLIFWLVVSFFLMYFFLSRFILPQLGQTIQSRKDHIEMLDDQHENLLEQIKEIEERMEVRLNEVRDDALARIQNAEQNFQRELDKKASKLNQDVKKKETELTQRLTKEQERVLEKFKDQLPSLSSEMFQRITGKAYVSNDAQHIINDVFHDMIKKSTKEQEQN